MLNGYRVVSITPAGRRKYLEILVPYLLDNMDVIDEHHFWVNTQVPEDIEYLLNLQNKYPNFFKLQFLSTEEDEKRRHGIQRITLIRHFFKRCIDENTVYIRFDDDICWIHPQAVRRLVEFRINNPQYFLVYPAIINNGRTAFIHQAMGHAPLDLTDYHGDLHETFNLLQISDPVIAERLHHSFLSKLADGKVNDLLFGRYIISNYERVPINCISWFGSEFAKFGGVVGNRDLSQEEPWLTEIKTRELGKPSCIWGQSLVAHFAYHVQREHLETHTNLLAVYEDLSKYRHEDNFDFIC